MYCQRNQSKHIEENMQKIVGVVHEKMRHHLIGFKEGRVDVMRSQRHFKVNTLAFEDQTRYKKSDVEQQNIFSDLRYVLKHGYSFLANSSKPKVNIMGLPLGVVVCCGH